MRDFFGLLTVMFFTTACSIQWANKVTENGSDSEAVNNYDKAMRHYNRAIRFNKESVFAYWRRAALRYRNEQFDKSIADLDKAIQIDSTFNRGYLFGDRGNAKEIIGDYQSAITDYTTAILLCRIEPNRPSTPKENFFHYRARAYVSIGDTISAINDLDSAISYWDKMSSAIWLRAQLKVTLRRYEEAMQDYKSFPLDDSEARFDYYADDFYYQGLCKFNMGDTTYCNDWRVAASYQFVKAIRDLDKYCKK